MKTLLSFLAVSLLATQVFAAALPVFNLTAKNGHWEPANVQIPAGQKIELIVKNEGPGAEEFESVDLNREKVIAPGKTISVYLGPLKAGNYGFFGDFHPTTAKGQLVVVEPASAPRLKDSK